MVAKAIDVRAVVLAAGPQESFPTSEEELSTIHKPIARKAPDRVMQLASVDRMMHPDALGAEIASLMAIAAPPRRRKKENMRFIARNIGGKVRHLGRWRSDLGPAPVRDSGGAPSRESAVVRHRHTQF